MLIKEKRKEFGMTQKELACKVGISHSALCQYEKGQRHPSIELLKKLSVIFGCTIDELVKGE